MRKPKHVDAATWSAAITPNDTHPAIGMRVEAFAFGAWCAATIVRMDDGDEFRPFLLVDDTALDGWWPHLKRNPIRFIAPLPFGDAT